MKTLEKKLEKEKGEFTKSAVTLAHSVFISSNLDTVAGWARRIFLCEGVVQGRSKTRQLHVNVKFKKKKKKLTKARSLRSLHVHGNLRTQRKAERSGLGGGGWGGLPPTTTNVIPHLKTTVEADINILIS